MAYIIGSFFKWDTLAWYCSSMAALFGLVLISMPESPVWLRSKKRFKEAEASATWLKLPPPSHVIPEKIDLELTQFDKNGEKPKQKSIYLTRPIVMPLVIGLSLLVLQQISGIDAIIFFTVEIFRESGNNIALNCKPFLIPIWLQLYHFLSSMVTGKKNSSYYYELVL